MSDPPPRQRTVDDVAAPYGNFLVPVPAAGPDVCFTCHSVVTGGFPACFKCYEARKVLGPSVADAMAFISLAPGGEQMARELYSYKSEKVPPRMRRQKTAGLAAVLWKWLNRHERCLAITVGIDRFDVLTSVPSTSGRHLHP